MAARAAGHHHIYICCLWLKFQGLVRIAVEDSFMLGFQHVGRVPLHGLQCSALTTCLKLYCRKHMAYICMKFGTVHPQYVFTLYLGDVSMVLS